MKRKRLQFVLALLMTAATGAWADDTFSTSPYETDKTFNNKVTVAANTTLTINKGVTVTAKAGLNIKSGATLTVTGGGTLAVRNQDGDNGLLGVEGTPNQPDPGMDAIFGGGTLAIDGAIVTANGGNGGKGGDGGTGGMGGDGGYGIKNVTVSIINGSITAIGGSGGQGGRGSSHPGEPVVTGRSGADGKGFSLFPSISGATICWSSNGSDWTPYENNTGETKRYMKAYRYTYSVSLNDGTLNPTTWTAKAGEAATFSALPLKGVAEGQSVTLKYSGRRKVKSVTATTDAEPDPLTVPLTMEAVNAGTIVVSNPKALTFKYSTDNGATKTETSATNVEIPVEAGDKVQFYGNNTTYSDGQKYFNINGSGSSFTCNVYGNIMSLLDEDNFATMTNLPNEEFVFYGLLCNNSTLIDASGLLLPAMTMTRFCYAGMFNNCVRLTAAPNLPAETLAVNCYDSMFFACYSLTTSPVLPAKTLVERCYYYMFRGCNVLVSVTCLATSGIKENSSTSAWLGDAGRTAEGPKTFIADPSASWPSGNSGIPSGWTRLNPDGTEYVAP